MTSLLKKFGAFSLALAVVAACAIPLAAQTPPTTATCTTAPASITTFSIERVLTLSNLLTTLTPTIPANILAGITSGAQEIRSRIIYNPTQGTVTDTTFLVAAGSPNPTPLGVDVTQQTIQGYVLQVDKVYTSCKPTPSVLFVGTVSGSAGPFGNPSGAPGAISIGYTTDTPPLINNVVELIGGQVVAYSAAGFGTLTFPAAPMTPTTTAGAPTIVINPVPVTSGSIQVFFNPYHVDASQSTDPNKLALTYSWSADKPVTFLPSNTDASPTIQFNSGPGDYTLTLTVTNSAGVSSTTKFILTLITK
jgi:hypothetical protein